MSCVQAGAVLLGGVFGAVFAISFIKYFDSNGSQLGFVAVCAIFGGITFAVLSAALPQGARKFRQPDPSRNVDAGVRPKCHYPSDSPPLSPQ